MEYAPRSKQRWKEEFGHTFLLKHTLLGGVVMDVIHFAGVRRDIRARGVIGCQRRVSLAQIKLAGGAGGEPGLHWRR